LIKYLMISSIESVQEMLQSSNRLVARRTIKPWQGSDKGVVVRVDKKNNGLTGGPLLPLSFGDHDAMAGGREQTVG
jgi:hypothetical protein